MPNGQAAQAAPDQVVDDRPYTTDEQGWRYPTNPLLPFRVRDAPIDEATQTIPSRIVSMLSGKNVDIEPSLKPAVNALTALPGLLERAEYGSPEEQKQAVPQLALTLGASAFPELGAEVSPTALQIFPAWHGTPHTFEPVEGNPFGEFRDKAIGSGEGAQAYGWGHYVAGREGTARSYMGEAEPGYIVSFDGKPIFNVGDRILPEFHPGFDDLDFGQKAAMERLSDDMYNGLGSVTETIKNLRTRAQSNQRLIDYSPEYEDSDPEFFNRIQDSIQHLNNGADWLEKNRDKVTFDEKPGGNLLNVSVRPEEHELLDWDAPLHEMEPELQNKLLSLGFESGNPEDISRVERLEHLESHLWNKGINSLHPDYVDDLINNRDSLAKVNAPLIKAGESPILLDDLKEYSSIHKWLEQLADTGEHIHQSPTGEEIYLELAQNRGPQGASEFLARNGIPGIRYWDQMSRAKQEGTSNYVIFDPKDLFITAKNGERLFPVDHDPWQGSEP